jgi:hypothetical protein
LKRFLERQHNPLKIWKYSPIDYVAVNKTGHPRASAGQDGCQRNTFPFLGERQARILA